MIVIIIKFSETVIHISDFLLLSIDINSFTIIVSYEVDEEQTKDLSYTVQHVVNGEVKDTLTEESTVQLLQPDMLVRNETLEADRKYQGYVKSGVAYADGSAVEGTEIANGCLLYTSRCV